jgi:translation initiation factor IF-1
MSKEGIELVGKVVNSNRDIFQVKIDSGGKEYLVQAKLAGKLRQNNIRILVNDRVKVEVSPYDLTKGRIVYRLGREYAEDSDAGRRS